MAGKIIVYGGYGGIGFTSAQRLKERGYELHLVGRDEARLASAADQLEAGYTLGDVTDTSLFATAAAEAGDELAGLVYAVGNINLRSLQRFSGDDYLRDFQLHAVGAALAIQAALPALKIHGTAGKAGEPASVVLYSSIAAAQGFPLHSSVGMAKGAVSGLTVSLAAELAPKVRVNAVAPSLTRTQLAGPITSNAKMADAIAAQHPLPRLGEASDIAAMTAFLISPDSSWITGQIIGVDGGRSSLQTNG